jgi:release factor glutamine methyltransferase
MQLNIQSALEIAHKLLALFSDTPSLDAQVLVADILDKSRAWVMAHPEACLNAAQTETLQQALKRLENGEPLPYILGRQEFYGLDFVVTPAVLIPRPETELLVESALSWLRANPSRRWAADIGTGSGCIASALATNITDLRVAAIDVSWPALEVARQNITRHKLAGRVHPVQIDLLQGIRPAMQKRFDLICANLPYIPQKTLASLDQLRWEPETALHGGRAGTELIQRMLADVPQTIMPDGLLLIEIEASLGAAVTSMVQAALPGAKVLLHTDLAGLDRLIIAQT